MSKPVKKSRVTPKKVVATLPDLDNQVVIVFCSPGKVNTYWFDALDKMRIHDAYHNRYIAGTLSGKSGANISKQRNVNMHVTLDQYETAEWILLLDTDMVCPPDTIDRLIASADPIERPIVGGLCFGYDEETRRAFPTLYLQDEKTGLLMRLDSGYPKDTLCRVSATGTACLLVHRSVFEKIQSEEPNNQYPWFYEMNDGTNWWGEDVIFCLRSGSLDIPIYVDTSIKVGHRKEIEINEEFYDRQMQTVNVAAVKEKLAGLK